MRGKPRRELLAAALLLTSLNAGAAEDKADTPPEDWRPLDGVIGSSGVVKDDVCTYTVPRSDLDVSVDGMGIPTAAGIASELRFFRCTCGKTWAVGQLCCADYEVNDVLDAIRVGAAIQVTSVSPMFLSDRPRVMVIRFQGEGDGMSLAKLLRAGLDWMGDARLAAQRKAAPTSQTARGR